MHTGDRRWKESGYNFGFCNCCACDCYPFRAGIALSMSQQWPRAHHVAVWDKDKCTSCGTCARRCQFGAFHFDGNTVTVKGRELPTVNLDPEKCWGCGLCFTGCRFDAITMRPLEQLTTGLVSTETKLEEWIHD
jgi:ferredoxin